MNASGGARQAPRGGAGRGDSSSFRGGGIAIEQLTQILLNHRHSGGFSDGQQLYGPYFIRDDADGHTYKLTCHNGQLGVTAVS